MIRISQLKLPVNHSPEALLKKTAKMLHVAPESIQKLQLVKRSLDARKKPELYYSYTLDVRVSSENNIIHKSKSANITSAKKEEYRFPKSGGQAFTTRPIIIGTGPAGLFCGLMLARYGYRPLILERGEDVETRKEKVTHFWETGDLDIRSNVQFGEGGAGTFSDGKLNTLVKDPGKRNQLVLELFHEFGAGDEILYENKPHIGTDVLSEIVKGMRKEIIRLGGEVRFSCQVTDLIIRDGVLSGVVTEHGEHILAEAVVLAIGHSARDTFEMLYEKNVPMDQKAFAVGLRVQHPQTMINQSQYGCQENEMVGAASYKLTRQTISGRGVYSFCMCPGGYVVNASSEKGHLAVNGMSYHDRSGTNANSAIIVTVTPEDFEDRSPLAGVEYQRQLERLAYKCAGGAIPIQLYGDFKADTISQEFGKIKPQTKGTWAFANLREVFPSTLSDSLIEAMDSFGSVIRGFSRADAILAGVESRTSSPVRIWRNECFESDLSGLYPCGEGAGYAGGITSAAMDGIKVAEAIAMRFKPF